MGTSIKNYLNLPVTESSECTGHLPLVIANNIVTNHLIDLSRTGKAMNCRIAPGRHVRITRASDPDPEFAEYDLAVLAALNAIWQDSSNPESTFTLTSLCRQIGYTTRGGVAETSRIDVSASLARLEGTLLQIQPEADFEPHRKDFIADNNLSILPSASWNDITGVKWGSPNPLVEISRSTKITERAGNPVAEVTLKLTTEPLLHLYSRVTGQFVTLDPRFMHPVFLDADGARTESHIPMTSTRIGMAYYTACQIERIRYTAEHPSRRKAKGKTVAVGTLKLSTIFDRVGLEKRDASRNKGRHLKFLSSLMSCWTAQGLLPAWSMRKALFHSYDALIIDYSCAAGTVPEQPACELTTAAEMGNAPLPASEIETTIEALCSIVEALRSMIAAVARGSTTLKIRLQSQFQSVCDELNTLRNYCKYISKHPPATPGGAGGALK